MSDLEDIPDSPGRGRGREFKVLGHMKKVRDGTFLANQWLGLRQPKQGWGCRFDCWSGS